MKNYLQTYDLSRPDLTNRQLVDALRVTLEKNYTRIFEAAGQKWERRFGRPDPSDKCVSVRISGRKRLPGGRRLRMGAPGPL